MRAAVVENVQNYFFKYKMFPRDTEYVQWDWWSAELNWVVIHCYSGCLADILIFILQGASINAAFTLLLRWYVPSLTVLLFK